MALSLNQFPRHIPGCCEVRKATGNKPVRRHALDKDQLHQGHHHAISHQLHLSVRAGKTEKVLQLKLEKRNLLISMCLSHRYLKKKTRAYATSGERI